MPKPIDGAAAQAAIPTGPAAVVDAEVVEAVDEFPDRNHVVEVRFRYTRL